MLLASCVSEPAITEQEAIAAIRKFDAGWEHKDTAAVDSALSPKYIYFTQSGNLFSRDSVVATAAQSSYFLNSMERSELAVTLSGNTAVVSTRWKGVGVYRGNAFNEDQRCSITLVKTKGTVQFLSEHCTPIRSAQLFH